MAYSHELTISVFYLVTVAGTHRFWYTQTILHCALDIEMLEPTITFTTDDLLSFE